MERESEAWTLGLKTKHMNGNGLAESRVSLSDSPGTQKLPLHLWIAR
jgi:hypothetical protein